MVENIMAKFIPPKDMDKECIELCTRLNELGDVRTFESCCGHLKSWYSVWFECRSFVRLAKLYRCVDRNYSDGKWEILVDGTDVHPTYIFWLRSREVFETYEEMKESVDRLIANIDYWEDKRFDSYFENNGDECRVHEYHKEVGLNDYERFYFRRFFHDNIERLERFRKVLSKEQSSGFYRGEPYVVKEFKIKGDKIQFIKLSRKKVDAYIKELKEKGMNDEKISE